MPAFLFNPAQWDDWETWFDDHGAALLLTLFFLILTWWLYRTFVVRFLQHAVERAGQLRGDQDIVSLERRARTLAATLNWVGAIFIGFVGIGLVLSQIGLNVSALIAGVGVAGIAIGLGAQTLVKDVINGLFILMEDQYRVGDVVAVAGVAGEVIELNPRRTVLRDLDGNMHIVPNSAVTVATNMTRGFSRVNLNMRVGYEQDIDRVIEVINDECRQLALERPGDILKVPEVLRIDAFQESAVELKITGDVQAGKQWELTGLLRARLKRRFDAEGIDIPYLHAGTISRGAGVPGGPQQESDRG
ncbi:MAG: mechanosensitive ion channel family protein [Dehalococcoidia bacterium]